MPIEFPYTYQQALDIIRQHIPDFTKEEMDTIIAQRKIRWSYVNGEFRIFNRFFSSLVKAYVGFAQRANQTLPGVESAVADLEKKNVTVIGNADVEAIKNAIIAEDYEILEG
jgi:hypothetical protein